MNIVIIHGLLSLLTKDESGVIYGNLNVFSLWNDIPFTFTTNVEELPGSGTLEVGSYVVLHGTLDHDRTGIQILVTSYAVM
jgi:hypothetical protein